MTLDIRHKRIYDPAEETDGYRVLVDRMWPRGISKEEARLDEWVRDLAPTRDLRAWFSHRPERFEEFQARYRQELEGHAETLTRLREQAALAPLTLLYAARDTEHNNAVVLAAVLRDA